jgi:2-polyprenyl-6-methoxyphenol hydroxylase-like FAD-dependent oxidoreductase
MRLATFGPTRANASCASQNAGVREPLKAVDHLEHHEGCFFQRSERRRALPAYADFLLWAAGRDGTLPAAALSAQKSGGIVQTHDVVVVGGGVGGASLGGALARAGLDVLVLERTEHFEDRVRGEWMAPWGVSEAKRLGVYEELMAAGGHHLTRHAGYDELLDPDVVAAEILPIDQLTPDSPGPLCLEHVTMQEVLLEQAARSGAKVLRGVQGVQIEAGSEPSVRFAAGHGEQQLGCRWIVGADGRSSGVRRKLGIELIEDPVDHLIAGLLIEDCAGWPDDLQAMGKVGDIAYLVFPQGGGKARLYADFDLAHRNRFAGPDGAARLLEAFRMSCVPGSQHIADARPIGPCRTYPSQDAWTERPYVGGAVLIGDAAGYNDPIIGQGLSITMRDARWVRDLLTSGEAWQPALFEPYAEERRERIRRLRMCAAFTTNLFARFDDRGLRRREHALEKLEGRPDLAAIRLAAFVGPDALPAELFEESLLAEVFGA